MDQWKLWLVHLLPLCLCVDREVTHVKTSGREPYFAPVCSTKSLRKNALVLCQIHRERSSGENCFLMYRHEWDFQSECDSRFTIMTMNQTVFLHLTSLTPVDNGNYTCRCPYPDGKDLLLLKITVEEPSSWILITTTTVIGSVFIIVTAVVLGHILRKKHCRHNTRSGASELPVCETPFSLDPDDDYTNLQQPAGDLYDTVSSVHRQHDAMRNSSSNIVTDHEEDQETDDGESREIYENI